MNYSSSLVFNPGILTPYLCLYSGDKITCLTADTPISVTGPTGSPGLQGDTGPGGARGLPGIGVQGSTGPTGAVGPMGNPGRLPTIAYSMGGPQLCPVATSIPIAYDRSEFSIGTITGSFDNVTTFNFTNTGTENIAYLICAKVTTYNADFTVAFQQGNLRFVKNALGVTPHIYVATSINTVSEETLSFVVNLEPGETAEQAAIIVRAKRGRETRRSAGCHREEWKIGLLGIR